MTAPVATLVLHGGAGDSEATPAQCAVLEAVLSHGSRMLLGGSSALDVVTDCVAMLEDSAEFNAGRGSVLNADGDVEMDAGVMDGRDLSAGAVAVVRRVRNPIHAARAVMEKTSHLLIAGPAADEFAARCGVTMESQDYFRTQRRVDQWRETRHFGTVGAVARDGSGNLAAATSTGGVVNKLAGRVGDTPIVGAGVYADNRTCAVSVTGVGEHCMRTVLAKGVADLIEYRGLDAQAAADAAVASMVERINGAAGLIVVDSLGHCGVAKSTPSIAYAATPR